MKRLTRTGRVLLVLALVVFAGCKDPIYFPAEAMDTETPPAETYDLDGDGHGDVFFDSLSSTEGSRLVSVSYDRDEDGVPDSRIELDDVPVEQCRHLVIILDGLSYDVVNEYRATRGLRLFHPPSKLVAPYPTMTDMCVEDLLGYVPVKGFQAEYYNHRTNRVVGGAEEYLAGRNQPYNQLLQYRADLIVDAVAYLYPMKIFGHELDRIKQTFDKRASREVVTYVVSSAGVSTRDGKAGQFACLREVDRLVKQVVAETRGLTKITLISDHGHTYTPARSANLEAFLEKKGWNVTDRLKDANDAVLIRFGLVTMASLSSHRPDALAKDLSTHPAVELASVRDRQNALSLNVYGPPSGDDAPRSHAKIRRTENGRFVYEPVAGDPLKLEKALETLAPDTAGAYDPNDLLAATVDHEFPAPLQRLWRAHFTLVENPPDVIVSLRNEYYNGSDALDDWVEVNSTHGGLNRTNSVSFIMSTIRPLPPVMRSRDVPAAMRKALGSPRWPVRE
jgi:hypothetical protein